MLGESILFVSSLSAKMPDTPAQAVSEPPKVAEKEKDIYQYPPRSYEDDEPESRLTRLGLTPESFRRRKVTDQERPLNHSMKMRHLNMIAIGGSIGAGFFVGSGSALAKGVIGPLQFVVYALTKVNRALGRWFWTLL
jgi:amino acid permease